MLVENKVKTINKREKHLMTRLRKKKLSLNGRMIVPLRKETWIKAHELMDSLKQKENISMKLPSSRLIRLYTGALNDWMERGISAHSFARKIFGNTYILGRPILWTDNIVIQPSYKKPLPKEIIDRNSGLRILLDEPPLEKDKAIHCLVSRVEPSSKKGFMDVYFDKTTIREFPFMNDCDWKGADIIEWKGVSDHELAIPSPFAQGISTSMGRLRRLRQRGVKPVPLDLFRRDVDLTGFYVHEEHWVACVVVMARTKKIADGELTIEQFQKLAHLRSNSAGSLQDAQDFARLVEMQLKRNK